MARLRAWLLGLDAKLVGLGTLLRFLNQEVGVGATLIANWFFGHAR